MRCHQKMSAVSQKNICVVTYIYTVPVPGSEIKPLIIFKEGAGMAEKSRYDDRVYVIENEKAWQTDATFGVYMHWLGTVVDRYIKGKKIWWVDDCPSHFSNKELMDRLLDFDVHLAKGIKNMTQFWQPADQYIISIFKQYIRHEIYLKIKEQEKSLEKYIAEFTEPPSPEQLEIIKKLIQMEIGQFRVWLTGAVGRAWDKLVLQDDVWTDSWLTSGLTLPVNGEQDEEWITQMIKKYGGTISTDDAPSMTESDRFNLKMRAITHLYNEVKMIPTEAEKSECGKSSKPSNTSTVSQSSSTAPHPILSNTSKQSNISTLSQSSSTAPHPILSNTSKQSNISTLSQSSSTAPHPILSNTSKQSNISTLSQKSSTAPFPVLSKSSKSYKPSKSSITSQQDIIAFLECDSDSDIQFNYDNEEEKQQQDCIDIADLSDPDVCLDLTSYCDKGKTVITNNTASKPFIPSSSSSSPSQSSPKSSNTISFGKGRGIINHFNKCYQNTIFQCWANLPILCNIIPSFFDLQPQKGVSTTQWKSNMSIVYTLYQVLNAVNDTSQTSPVDPSPFINRLPQRWCNQQQQDCTEWYAYLTTTLGWLLDNSTTKPMLLFDIIQFPFKSIITCSVCGIQTEIGESLCSIQVCYYLCGVTSVRCHNCAVSQLYVSVIIFTVICFCVSPYCRYLHSVHYLRVICLFVSSYCRYIHYLHYRRVVFILCFSLFQLYLLSPSSPSVFLSSTVVTIYILLIFLPLSDWIG